MVRRLFETRGLDPEGTIGEFGSTPPFMVLEQGPSEWVAGVGAFGLYWPFVGRFSKMIRRRWLRAMEKRAGKGR